MASGFKFNAVAALHWNAGYNLLSDVVKIALSNTAPSASNVTYSDITEIASGNGYTTGGATLTLVSAAQVAGLFKYIATAASPTWTATGNLPTFRYVFMYDNTVVAKNLIAAWDYGTAVSMVSGDTFTFVPDATNGLIQDS